MTESSDERASQAITVLLVEDDAPTCWRLQDALAKAGFDVDDDGKKYFHIVTGVRIRFHRPVNHNRAPQNSLPVNKSPVAAVRAAIAVVAHRKIFIRRHDQIAIENVA